MSILLCTSCQAADGSNLFASCNRFQSVDQFGICDAMWILALADVHGDSDYVRKECRVLQGRDVKALSEQRQSNMQVWNCTACGTCAQIGCICMESEPSVAYPDRATQTFWTPTCTAVASHTMYSSGITYYLLQLLQACSFVYLWYLTCLLLPGKEGISLHTPYVPSKHDSSIQMSGTPSDLCRKGR